MESSLKYMLNISDRDKQ